MTSATPNQTTVEPARDAAAVTSRPTPANLGVLWGAASATAALGTWVIWEAAPGINWTLWVLAASAGLLLLARRGGKRIETPVLVPVALACLLALGAAVTASEVNHVLIVLTTATLLAAATLFVSGHTVERAGPVWIAFAPVVAAIQVLIESLKRAGEAIGLVRADRSAPVLRGIVIALPVVGLFGLLLAGVDPVLGAWRDAVVRLLESFEWIPRLMFFLFLGGLTLGAFGLALRPAASDGRVRGWVVPWQLGVTERTILLGSVAALFALFLGLQLSYLFGNAPVVAGSGITFAEYARRGFGELTFVATLCTVLILGTDYRAKRGAGEERVRLLQLLLVGELQLLLASAFRRVMLYESAYGFTTARLYAQAYMVVVSILLVMLAWEIWTGIDVRRLTRRGALVGGATFAVLTFWNHESWIATQNLERYASTGTLDVGYLARDLSPNAVPTVVAALERVGAAEATSLRHCLHSKYSSSRMWTDGPRWYEWNLRRSAARRALARGGIDVHTPPIPDASLYCLPPDVRAQVLLQRVVPAAPAPVTTTPVPPSTTQ